MDPDDNVRRQMGGLHESVVGIGPDQELVAYWSAKRGTLTALTRTTVGVRERTLTVVVQDAPEHVSFVQPMPDGGFLLSASQTRGRSEKSAGVWDHEGHRIAAGNLGDVIQHVLATRSGQVWTGYFDEANGSNEFPSGVARFHPDLTESWRYQGAPGIPDQFDCYSLNVDDETATSYAYTDWHLTRISGSTSTDLGRAPHIGASGLLIGGERAALIGGYFADYDLLTPLHVTSDGIHLAGAPRRLVLPNGLEVSRPVKLFCRGPELHVIHYRTWYRLNLSEI